MKKILHIFREMWKRVLFPGCKTQQLFQFMNSIPERKSIKPKLCSFHFKISKNKTNGKNDFTSPSLEIVQSTKRFLQFYFLVLVFPLA
ncbi:hypothetical protein D8B45_02690 [Candidatus Gracilibacteria bacterium]|nr:MAG: hypothetical protein D8B45_02690 [Candidatus Gracilibacteria bacterium]